MVDTEEEEKEKKRHEEEEEWFQEYYGRGKVGMKALVEGMELCEEMGAWVERRVEVGKVMEKREEEMRKDEEERRKRKKKAEIERRREWSPRDALDNPSPQPRAVSARAEFDET
ncbi:MAG: hypothetical protein Q9171_007054 [Xanthocarpia ochracea]